MNVKLVVHHVTSRLYKVNIPNICTHTFVYIYIHIYISFQISPTCFGVYCTIFRENSLSLFQNYLLFVMLHCLQSIIYTGCPTRYQTRHFFNNSNTNEDIATKFEQEYVRCVRNEKECVCNVCLYCA